MRRPTLTLLRNPGLWVLGLVVLVYFSVAALLLSETERLRQVEDANLSRVLLLERLQVAFSEAQITGDATAWRQAQAEWSARPPEQGAEPSLITLTREFDALVQEVDEAGRRGTLTPALSTRMVRANARLSQQYHVAHLAARTEERLRWDRIRLVLFAAMCFSAITVVLVVLADEGRQHAEGLGQAHEAALRELERTERQLRASERRYALAALGANDGLFDWNLETGQASFSVRFKELLGDILLGDEPLAWLARLPDDQRPAVEAELQATLSGAQDHLKTTFRVGAPPQARWLLLRAAVERAADRASRLAGSLTDVTDLRQAAATAHEVANLEAALSAAGVGAVLQDADGLHHPSRLLEQLLRPFGGLEAWAEEIARASGRPLTQLDPAGQEVELRGPEGQERVFEVRATPVAEGQLWLITDRTAARLAANLRAELTSRLRAARDEALLASEERARLLRRLAQELRRLLQGLGSSERLPEEVTRGLSAIARLNDGVERLSWLERSPQLLPTATLSLPDLLGPVVAAGRAEAELRGNVLLAPTELEGELRIDVAATREVLHELLANANRFTVDGTLSLSVLRDGDFWAITVRDTGVGVDPTLGARVFEPFVRTAPPAGRVHDGPGLGLTIAQRTAERLGGSLSLRPDRRTGATFQLRLPANTGEGRSMA